MHEAQWHLAVLRIIIRALLVRKFNFDRCLASMENLFENGYSEEEHKDFYPEHGCSR